MFYLIHYNILTKNTSLKQFGNKTWSVQTIKQENGREIILYLLFYHLYIRLVCQSNNYRDRRLLNYAINVF